MKGSPFTARLRHASAGLIEAWHREKSVRSQAGLATVAIVVGVAVRARLIWWAVLVLAIAMVLVAEIMNSALEALADHLHPSEHPSIKSAKDMAAGAVLLASIAASIVGVCLLFSVL